MGHRPERLNPRSSSPDSWYGKNLLGQALKTAREILRRGSTTPPDDPAPETPVPRDVTGDTVFEVDPITHLRLDTTPLPANAQTAALSACTDSVPDDHAPEVLLAHEQRDDAPLMPEQGPDLIGGIVTMDDTTFTTLLTLHSGVFATSRFDCRAILDSYLAAGLVQHSTSPQSSPLVCVQKKSGGIRITANYQKLNKVTEISQIAIPLVDEVLDTLGGGSVFSVFDLFSGFTQLTIHPDTIPLTAFCTPNGLYKWLRMPPGAAGAPAWFVSVMRLATAGLDNIVMYLDAIGPDDCPLHHVATPVTFFARLRLHKLKLSPDKSRIGAAHVDFWGHVILADGVRPNDARVAALARMPMPTDIKQLRSLVGGLSYYRKFLPNMAHHIRPVTALLKKGAAFEFTSATEDTVRTLLAELAAPSILVFPDRDAVIDTSRPFRFHFDASTAGLGATLEQEQPDGSIRPIVYISRATLDNEQNWTPMELEAGCVVWSIRRLRRYLFGVYFLVFTDHQYLQQICKIGKTKPRIQRWMEFLLAYNFRLSYR